MQTTTRAIQGEPAYTRVKREPTRLLSLYNSPPSAEITLEEFELYALDRLQVLRTIESLRLRAVKGDEFRMKLEEVLHKCLPMSGTEAEVKKDQISHFILRIAYCKMEDLRRWFLKQESDLFRFRLERLDAQERAKFMEQNELAYDAVPKEDVQRLKAQLQAVPVFAQLPGMGGAAVVDVMRTQFFRIPFTQALDLVAHRQVFLENGMAYVPVERLVSIIVARFRATLSRGLLDAFSSYPYILADTRIAPLVANMSTQYTGKDFSQAGSKSGDAVGIDDLDDLADRSMPLCMRVLHKALRREHKLKHLGRLQYGLFLKGVGLSLEDALRFWEKEFTKIMNADVFNKQYAYSVRHYFGKEGRRKDYTPYNCSKIILGPGPGHGEYHGCPYKHFDDANLNKLLERSGVGTGDRDEMLRLSRGQHYQLACAKHFEVAHKGAEALISMDGVGNHPNAWFAASMAYYKELNKDKKNGGPTPPPPTASSSSSSSSQAQAESGGAPPSSSGSGSAEAEAAAMEVEAVN